MPLYGVSKGAAIVTWMQSKFEMGSSREMPSGGSRSSRCSSCARRACRIGGQVCKYLFPVFFLGDHDVVGLNERRSKSIVSGKGGKIDDFRQLLP